MRRRAALVWRQYESYRREIEALLTEADLPRKRRESEVLGLGCVQDLEIWLEVVRAELDMCANAATSRDVGLSADERELAVVRAHFEMYGDHTMASENVENLLKDLGGEYTKAEAATVVAMLEQSGSIGWDQFRNWWTGCLDAASTSLEKDTIDDRILVTTYYAAGPCTLWRFWVENLHVSETVCVRMSVDGSTNVVIENGGEVTVPPFSRATLADLRRDDPSTRWHLQYAIQWRIVSAGKALGDDQGGLVTGLALPRLRWERHEVVGMPSARGLRQGALRDNCLLGSLVAVALVPGLLHIDAYTVRLYPGGRSTQITVEPDYPVLEAARCDEATCVFGSCCDPLESWVQLVEKAVALALGGSYKAIEDEVSSVADGLALLSGMPSAEVDDCELSDVAFWLAENALVVYTAQTQDRAHVVLKVMSDSKVLRCCNTWGPAGEPTVDITVDATAAFAVCRPTDSTKAAWHVSRCARTLRKDDNVCLFTLALETDAAETHVEVAQALASPLALAILAMDGSVLHAAFPCRLRRLSTAWRTLRDLRAGQYDVVCWTPTPSMASVVASAHSTAPIELVSDPARFINLEELVERCARYVVSDDDKTHYPEHGFSIYSIATAHGASFAVENTLHDRAIHFTMDCSKPATTNAISHQGHLVVTRTIRPRALTFLHHLYPAHPGTWSWSFECDWVVLDDDEDSLDELAYHMSDDVAGFDIPATLLKLPSAREDITHDEDFPLPTAVAARLGPPRVEDDEEGELRERFNMEDLVVVAEGGMKQ